MIKLPKEVSQALKTLKESGFEAYAAGACVRESMMGKNPLDWDIITSAGLDDLETLFPQAQVFSKSRSILRIDKTTGGNEDGIILDISTFCKKEGETLRPCQDASVEEDLKTRHFTVNAIADDPSGAVKDPFKGRDDIKNKLIRPIGDAEAVFKEDPILMMEAVLLAAELDFDIPKTVYDAMIQASPLLIQAKVSHRRELLKEIIVSEHAGKGLRMLAGAELMPALIGEAALKMSARQRELFRDLADGIDKLKPVAERRLGLFYQCFEKKGLEAIELLEYDEKTHQHLVDGMTQMEKIYFIRDKIELKKYIYQVGMERYDYVHNLAKAHRIVYPQGNVKVQNRHYMLEDILANKEPIFVEDLAIDETDILEAGITDSPERAAYLLSLLPAVVHGRPSQNKKDKLLVYARKFHKSKIRTTFRGVKWLK